MTAAQCPIRLLKGHQRDHVGHCQHRRDPDLFRTAAASTAAVYAGNTSRLAGALLHHTDPVVTEDTMPRHTLSAAQVYAALIRAIRNGD